jgi:hypothetical protein
MKAKYVLQIYTFKYNETKTKVVLKEETSHSRDHRANKEVHVYHQFVI